MTYSQQLHPWCIIRVLPTQQLDNAGACEKRQQSNIVARFRKRADAVAYQQVLEHSVKNIKFLIIFDVQGVEKLSESDALN